MSVLATIKDIARRNFTLATVTERPARQAELMLANLECHFGDPMRVPTVQLGGSLAGKLSCKLSSTISSGRAAFSGLRRWRRTKRFVSARASVVSSSMSGHVAGRAVPTEGL